MRQTPTASPIAGILVVFAVLSVMPACGDDATGVRVVRGPGDDTSFGDGTTVVVTDEGTFVVTGDPGDACVLIGSTCVDLNDETGQFCNQEGAQADIIVVDGEVVEIICYPPADDGTPVEEVELNEDGVPEVSQPQNGAVIVFDESTDGEVVEGDLNIEAERTTIFGNGVDETTLGGNLTLTSNNSRVRGLTVQGNVTYGENSNNSALSFCRVHGNLRVESNGFTGLDCEVFGNVEVYGNNPVLVDIGVGGNWDVTGSGPFCDGCYSFSDDNGDFLVDSDEVGELLTCEQ